MYAKKFVYILVELSPDTMRELLWLICTSTVMNGIVLRNRIYCNRLSLKVRPVHQVD